MANSGLFCQLIVIPLFKDHKILTQVAGHGIHTIKLLPPLIITDSDCDWIETLVRRRDRRRASRARRRLVARQDAGRQCDARTSGRLGMIAGSVIAALALAIWLYLIAGRGGFLACIRARRFRTGCTPHDIARRCRDRARPQRGGRHRRQSPVASRAGLSRFIPRRTGRRSEPRRHGGRSPPRRRKI